MSFEGLVEAVDVEESLFSVESGTRMQIVLRVVKRENVFRKITINVPCRIFFVRIPTEAPRGPLGPTCAGTSCQCCCGRFWS